MENDDLAKLKRDFSQYQHDVDVALQIIREQLRFCSLIDVAVLRQEITDDIMEKISTRSVSTAASPELTALIDEKINKKVSEATVANESQLVVANEKNREMMEVVGQQVCDAVYDQVINEINENIVPKVNNMVQWVNYSMQDGGEVVDSYRRTVEKTLCSDPNVKLITDGKNDKRIISEHVRLFFDDDD